MPKAHIAPKSAVEALLRPRAIAVVGASGKENSFGWRLMNGIIRAGFQGAIYPINPNYGEILGQPCYPDLASVAGEVDCVAMGLSDQHLEVAMGAAAAKGARGAVVFSRGYEPPETAPPTQIERWSAVAREAGMAVCGGNCMGFINYVDRLTVTGNPPNIPEAYRPTRLPGNIAILSHSGSTWSGLNGNQRQQAFSYTISVGREDVTRMADYLAFLLEQEDVRTIGLVMETIRDPDRFVGCLETAMRKNIPIVALQLGRSDAGGRFVQSHSGALAGSSAAFAALFARHNVSQVRTLDEFSDTLELFASNRRPTAAAIGLATDSGGERELITDIAHDVSAPFAEISQESRHRLAAVLDPGLDTTNPVDYWGDGRFAAEDALKILADDPAVGMLVLATNMVAGRPSLYMASGCIENINNYSPKPAAILGNLHSSICREEAKRLRGLGIPVLMGTETGLLAIRHFLSYQQAREAKPIRVEPADAALVARWRAALEGAPSGPLDITTATRLLADFGVRSAGMAVVASAEDAVAAAKRIGFPVVVKTAEPEVIHKTEGGGVMLDIVDADGVGRAYARMRELFGPRVQIQAQAAQGVELFLGMVNDQLLGPMARVGLGGIFIEVLHDFVTFMPPIGASEARQLLMSLNSYPLLAGARGADPVDLDALSEVVACFSVLCRDIGPFLDEIDANPLIAGPHGATAVDALVIPKTAAASSIGNRRKS